MVNYKGALLNRSQVVKRAGSPINTNSCCALGCIFSGLNWNLLPNDEFLTGLVSAINHIHKVKVVAAFCIGSMSVVWHLSEIG